VALAGVAKPTQFFEMLSALGLPLTATLSASDHASASELMGLLSTELGLASEPAVVLCTEKDAAKLWPLYPQAWSVALGVSLEPLFLEEFDLMLRHRLSFIHGHETH
jgi:tetraacyldisaccharide 4'-kinase